MIHGDQVDAQEVGRQEAHDQEGFPESSYTRGDVSNGPTAVAKAATVVGEALAQDIAPSEEAAPCTRSHVPNARTRKALRDADAGKNLTSYADADDLFRKLGIKLGQD